MSHVTLVLGDQLFDGLPGMDPRRPVFMMEDPYLLRRVRHHQQKLVLFLSAMRHFRDRLEGQGFSVEYIKYGDHPGPIYQAMTDRGVQRVTTYTPADPYFLPKLSQFVSVDCVANPMFLTPDEMWSGYRRRSKRLLMGDFYQIQRRRMNLLMQDGQPLGEKWSHDEDNRKPLPRSVQPPEIWGVSPDTITQEVIQLVRAHFANHPGSADGFVYPVTHADAADWLAEFLADRLVQFGPYEDALTVRSRTLFHSVLTPMLNCGLVTPSQIVEATIRFSERHEVPLNSLEGFIRQVVGWREFVKCVDEEYTVDLETPDFQWPNFFGHQRKLKPCWWDASTGLPPLDLVIQRTRDHAWCHHIERLMVAGSAMLMAEVHPKSAYEWFMTMFIDSADWVMRPNVIGMSQFADGGLFATKPYLSGSNYLMKMGDYERGPWCDVWDGLYWQFIDRHRDFFGQNPRMSVMVRGVDKLDAVKRDRIFTAADRWRDEVTTC